MGKEIKVKQTWKKNHERTRERTGLFFPCPLHIIPHYPGAWNRLYIFFERVGILCQVSFFFYFASNTIQQKL